MFFYVLERGIRSQDARPKPRGPRRQRRSDRPAGRAGSRGGGGGDFAGKAANSAVVASGDHQTATDGQPEQDDRHRPASTPDAAAQPANPPLCIKPLEGGHQTMAQQREAASGSRRITGPGSFNGC